MLDEVLMTEAGSRAVAIADETIRKVAADLLAKHESHPHYRAALFAAMGDEARERYFPDEAHEPWILRTPFSTDQQRAELIKSAKSEVEASVKERIRDAQPKASLVAALRRPGREAEDVGNALAAIVRQEELEALFLKCRGHYFPTSLRRVLWKRRLEGAVPKRKKTAANGDISRTVTRIVEETFSTTWRKVVAERNHVLRVTLLAETALNDLYATAGNYVPIDRRSAYVAIALSHVFCEEEDDNALFEMLYSMLTRLPPKASSSSTSSDRRRQADDISRDALEALFAQDPDLYRHLNELNTSPVDLLRPFVDAYLAPLLPFETLLFVWDHGLLEIEKWEEHLSFCMATILKLLRLQLLTAQTREEVLVIFKRSPGFVGFSRASFHREVSANDVISMSNAGKPEIPEC